MNGRMEDAERLYGAPLWVRSIHVIWVWALIILSLFLTYRFSHSFWEWCASFWDGYNIPSSEKAWEVVSSEGGISAFLAWFAQLFYRTLWLGYIVFYVILEQGLLKPFRYAWMPLVGGSSSAGGIAGWKRTKGFLAGSLISLVFLWLPYFVVLFIAGELLNNIYPLSGENGGYSASFFVLCAIGLIPLPIYFFWLKNATRERIGKFSAPVRRWWRRRGYGVGGSAAFAGMLEEWSLRYKAGSILLGSSLYSAKGRESVFKIGNKDDRHVMTIASARSGKGRSAIIPNLIEWPHSALVIDPKGTNAAVTAARRGKGGGRVTSFLGQDCYVIDPFGELEEVGIKSACFNPLSVLDMKDIRIVDDIRLLCEALVPPEKGSNAMYFVGGAREIIGGVIAHALTVAEDNGWPEPPTLIEIRQNLTDSATGLNELFGAMQQNHRLGGLPKSGANRFEIASENERGSYMNTISESMN